MNKISRHLRSDWYKYGLETLVVVAGILLAFALNNWNEERKERLQEEQLKRNLYSEVLEALEYNKEVLANNFDVHFYHLEPILSKGKELNIDAFIDQTKDFWVVKDLSLSSYILSYTVFYDPNFKFYKAAINDGTISIIKDKDFINDLEFIYVNGPARLDRLYRKEVELNNEIQHHISLTYPEVFIDKSNVNATWNMDTTRKLLEKITVDGTYRFLLQNKLSAIKSKRLIMETQIIPLMERIVASYDDKETL